MQNTKTIPVIVYCLDNLESRHRHIVCVVNHANAVLEKYRDENESLYPMRRRQEVVGVWI